MRRRISIVLGLLVVTGVAGWLATAPATVDASKFSQITPDIERGAVIFKASGCASCHSAPGTRGEARNTLSGGKSFASDFGTFYAPNISPDTENGIGNWDVTDLANALRYGTSPDGRHYYPAFPYTSYTKMTDADIVSLFAYIRTLPPSRSSSLEHDVGFPFNINRGLGAWKLLYLRKDWALELEPGSDLENGRYFVEALTHCGECHTPRNLIGGLDTGRWLAGAPNPSGKGTIPNITPAKLAWSDLEILDYLVVGMTPDFDAVGGSMADVVEELSQIPESHVADIVNYLKSVAPVE